jgi:hypothetical protein
LQAQRLAAIGDQVLLAKILETLDIPEKFLDGDTFFRSLHAASDEVSCFFFFTFRVD